MKIYTIHTNLSDPNPLENLVLIKEGFSWSGAFFQVFWALYNKMWLFSLILFSVSMILLVLNVKGIIGDGVSEAVKFGFFLVIGFSFNDWRRYDLENKGYIMSGVVSAKNEDEARYKIISDMLQCTTFGSGKHLPGLV
jgi:hypothetical protein